MKLNLEQLDLTKGDKNSHPKIDGRSSYLCLIDGNFYAGKFSKVWFGWHFDGWFDVGMQYDKPGYNSSSWQRIWKIRRGGKTLRKTAKLRTTGQAANIVK
jgi:hypothetical protein